MLDKYLTRGTAKEVAYVAITFSTYILVGIGRNYLAFLFHQLDLPDSTVRIDDEQKSWMASFITLLSPLGCLIVGYIMDVYGRKLSVQCVFVPYLISWFILALATGVEMLYIAALIQSISTGMSLSTATYVSEITTVEHRGACLGTIEITFNLGILLCNLLLYYLEWRIAAFIFAAISVVTLLFSFLLPESPSWLYLKGRKEKSISTLEAIRCQERSAIEHEIQDMEKYSSTQVKFTICQSIRNCIKAWKQLVIVIVLFLLQQNTGYCVMTLFIIMIIDSFHIPYRSTDVALLYSITCSVAGFITPFVMHKFGRKAMLTTSASGMALCSAIIAVHQHLYQTPSDKPYAWIVPVGLCLYIVAASIGILPIGFTVAGELFPNEVRGMMNGLYGAFVHIYWSILFKIFPWYLATFGGIGVMCTFATFAALAALYGIFILPETKGKTLNEVQEEYFKKKS